MNRKMMNIGKNVLLVLLSLIMALLTVLIWVRSLSWEDIPVESGIGQLYLRMAYGSASVFGLRTEDAPAAYPMEIAVRTDGKMYGAQNDTSGVDALQEQFQEQIHAALNISVQDLRPAEESEYREILKGDCIYFRYEHALPLDLLFLWNGDSSVHVSDVSAKSVLISSDDSVWIRDEKNDLYVYETEIDSKDWKDQLGDSIFQPCAFLQNKFANNLMPETLIFENRRQEYAVVEMSEPDYLDSSGTHNLQIVLEAFEYNTSVGNYMDNSTRVFVNNNSTLRIGPNGKILFHATSMEGGMVAYQESEVTDDGEMPLRISTAKAVLEQIQKSYVTESEFFLQSVFRDPATERIQLRFRYSCNGIPIVGDSGAYAVVEFLENTMVSAEIHARSFASLEEKQFLIPSEQFIAMADSSDVNLLLGYFGDNNVFYPRRYFESVV